MKTKYEIISNLLFPKFSQTKESRFLKFFSSLSEKNKTQKHYNYYYISIENIEKGEDKRTSVVIQNLPKNLTKDNLKKILEGIGNINYLYLPYDKVINRNLGFAIINVVNYKNIINLYNRLIKYNFENKLFNDSIEVFYSKIQGKNALSESFAKK
jgi:RNA recognition motif-containing protein